MVSESVTGCEYQGEGWVIKKGVNVGGYEREWECGCVGMRGWLSEHMSG